MVRCLPTSATRATADEIASAYSTHLGTITLTWTRSSLGILLLADLRLTQSADNDNTVTDHLHLHLRIRPYFKWKLKGSKHHRFTSATDRHRVVHLAWDFSLTTFKGPEPTGGFFLSISVDGETALVVGDRGEISGKGSEIVLRRERVRFGEETVYETKGRFGGKEMEVSILIDGGEGEMRLGIDGEIVLEVRRLCWKFRGVDGVELKRGGRILVAWDLHDWLFKEGEAVFVLRDWSDDGGGPWWGEEVEEGKVGSSGEGEFTLLVCGRKG